MKYSCAGLVLVSTPFSTRPGWDKHANGVEVGAGDKASACVCVAVAVAGRGVWVGGVKGVKGVTGAQATKIARNIKSIVICFARRIAVRIA